MALDELDECIATGVFPEELIDAKELGASIRRFLDSISEREQSIFIRRYFFVEEVAAIALRYDLKESNVHKILSRTRQKLKKHLILEGYMI